MDIYADIISKVVVVFYIYILNRALSNLSYSKKYYILFFISLGISVLFYLAYLYVDKIQIQFIVHIDIFVYRFKCYICALLTY